VQTLARNEPEATAVGTKTPHTRLLDLLAGWSNYAQGDETADDPAVVERICDLYQEAGNLSVGADSPADPTTETVIRTFLLTRVAPLLRGSVG